MPIVMTIMKMMMKIINNEEEIDIKGLGGYGGLYGILEYKQSDWFRWQGS